MIRNIDYAREGERMRRQIPRFKKFVERFGVTCPECNGDRGHVEYYDNHISQFLECCGCYGSGKIPIHDWIKFYRRKK